MPVFDITAPDGTKYEVTGPEGATEHDALSQVMAQHPSAAPKQAASPQQQDEGVIAGVGNMLRGAYHFPERAMQSVAEIGARGTDAVGLTDNVYPTMHRFFSEDNASAAGGSKYYKAGALMGDVGGTLPAMALKVPGLAAQLPRLAPVVNGALQGATAAAATSSESDKPIAEQMGLGALGGGALPVVTKAASRVLSPVINPAVQKLLDSGVPLTIGQTLGGAAKSVEDKLTSLPFVGDAINSARRRSIDGFNSAVLNSALKPIGQSLPKGVEPGRASVDYVGGKIGDAYDNLLPNMTGKLDHPLIQDLNGIVQGMVGDGAHQDTVTRFQNVIKTHLADRAPSGDLTGDALKTAQSQLGRLGRKYAASGSMDDQVLGHAILEAQGSFNQMLERNNPGFADQLKNVNTAFAQYARIRKAAGAVGSKDGVFSAPQYANAVKMADGSAGRGNYARGKAFMQDLSDPANQVLPSTVPDSGTAGRLALMSMGVGGAGLAGHSLPLAGPYALPMAAGVGAGMGLYSRPAQALLRSAVTKRPAWAPGAANIVQNYGILGAPALGALIGSSGY